MVDHLFSRFYLLSRQRPQGYDALGVEVTHTDDQGIYGFLHQVRPRDTPHNGQVIGAVIDVPQSVYMDDGDQIRDEDGRRWTVTGTPRLMTSPITSMSYIQADLVRIEGN